MPLTIIGAGLGRTGTVSLKIALEQLGFGRCYHMLELLSHPEHFPLWRRVLDGNPDWAAIFAGYGASTDYPGCVFWRELADFYPAAKIILSVRDPDEWFDSTQATVFSPSRPEMPGDAPFAVAFQVIRRLHSDLHDRGSMTTEFRRHNQAVIDAVPKDRLLVYRIEEGWSPLCAFLGVPVPEMPFPRSNTRAEMQAMFTQNRTAGGVDPEELHRTLRARLARLHTPPKV